MGASESRVSKRGARWLLALVPSWKVSLNACPRRRIPCNGGRVRVGITTPWWRRAKERHFCTETDTFPMGRGGGLRYMPEWPRDSSAGPQGTQGPDSTLQTWDQATCPRTPATSPQHTARRLTQVPGWADCERHPCLRPPTQTGVQTPTQGHKGHGKSRRHDISKENRQNNGP